MRKCILNVTPHEYDQILQLNHDRVEWDNTDRSLLKGLEAILGSEVVTVMREYEECRMEKHDDNSGMPRVAPDLMDPALTRIE